MKNIRLALLMFVIICMIFPVSSLAQDSIRGKTAEEIITSFAKEKGITAEEGTQEYLKFMKNILLGEYPELTKIGYKYVKNQADLDLIHKYVTEQMSPLFDDFPFEEDILDDFPAEEDLQEDVPGLDSSGAYNMYNRQNAINYAYRWYNGRNPWYPDFGDKDCTNFISQAMKAGGFNLYGSGDGCKCEDTEIEWYVDWNPSPEWWCKGISRNWEWSTSWTCVYPFRRYFTYHNEYATVDYTRDPTIAADYLSPGDIVQLQKKLSDGRWHSYHTMLVTNETSSDGLMLTYHSNNRLNKPLKDIPASRYQRYVLIRFS